MNALRRNWPWLAALSLTILAVIIAGPPEPGGRYLDPASYRPSGTRGLIETLEELGVDVQLGRTPTPDTDVALVLRDELDGQTRDALRQFAESGGSLVVADPDSPLARAAVVGDLVTDLVAPIELVPECDLPVVDGVGHILGAAWVGLSAEDHPGCFPVADGYWLVRRMQGAGEVISLGGADLFTNQRLALADNAVLAANLLVPSERGQLLVVRPTSPGEGDTGLIALLPDRVWNLAVLLSLAFVAVMLARGRRHGAVVDEDLPVRVPGSALVEARGHLLQRGRHRDAAASRLREGLDDELGPERPVRDDETLLAVARAAARVRAKRP